MGQLLRDAKRPVLLRASVTSSIRRWAGYDPNAYKLAFQRIVQRVRLQQADNVAFVWHSWGFQHSFNQASVAAWFPGDDYVDWIGVSLFPGWDAASTQAAEGARGEIASFAQTHNKPFMIAESGPRQAFEPSRGADAWNGWYTSVFDFITAHDGRKNIFVHQCQLGRAAIVGRSRLGRYPRADQSSTHCSPNGAPNWPSRAWRSVP